MHKYLIAFIMVILPLLFHKMRKYFNGPLCTFKPNLTGKVIIITGATGAIGK